MNLEVPVPLPTINPEAIAASGLTALTLTVAAIVALWRAFLGGHLVSGKTYNEGIAREVESRQAAQVIARDVTSELRRTNDINEKLLERGERSRGRG